MSEATLIRQGLADALSAALGEGIQVSPWLLSEATYPCVDVRPGSLEYHHAMGNGHAVYPFKVRALVAITTDIGAQQQLDEMLGVTGDLSVKAALEADPTLGGVCEDLIVRSTDEPVEYLKNNTQLIGVDWNVEVWA